MTCTIHLLCDLLELITKITRRQFSQNSAAPSQCSKSFRIHAERMVYSYNEKIKLEKFIILVVKPKD